ncbi:WhiB family transcriptional regulator [Saccharopolyspora taberi]|uniref:Transcriptional regulator WhiB n=1 Tax=Saccharopolyspora taberi TaxID=60895 RepID=A0ABN3VKA6_9PSEU
MLTTSVPISGEADAVGALLDSAPAVGSELPCGQDPDLWFAESPGELEQAKALCAECPIKAECLAGALSRGEPWGVWGGEIFERGSVIARKRPRGRPRKNPAPAASGSGEVRTGRRGQERAA